MAIDLDPATGLGQFFEAIWGTSEIGFVYLPTKDGLVWEKTFYRWPVHKSHVINHVLYNSSAGKDVYFSPMIWAKPILERSNIKGTFVLYADFDGNAPSLEEWTDRSQQAVSEAHNAAPGPPSIVIQSSSETHQHVYWKLDELNTDLSFVENTNRAIAYSYNADTSGWDVEQILRPPYSINYKHSLPVLVSTFDQSRYSSNEFASFAPVKLLIDEAIDEANLPQPLAILGKYSWDSETLDLLQKDISSGSRSSALMRIGYKCAELGLSTKEIYSLLVYADERIGKFKNRNDRKKRLLDIINKAMQRYPHKLEEPTFAGLTGDAPAVVDTQYVFGFGSFLAADFRVDWAIDNLMPMGGCGLVVSPPNVGKTQFLSQMGIHQALGKDFVGYKFNKPRKGIMFSLEMGRTGYHRLSLSLVKDHVDSLATLETNYIVVPLGEPMPLVSNANANNFFEKLIVEYMPDWISIDSLQKTIADKLDDEAVRALFNYLSSLRQKYGLYVWMIHHTRKAQGDNKKPNTLEDVYGSRWITSEPDTVLSLWDYPDKQLIEVSELKNRYAEKARPFYIARTPNLNFTRSSGEVFNAAGLVKGAPLGDDGSRQTNSLLGFS